MPSFLEKVRSWLLDVPRAEPEGRKFSEAEIASAALLVEAATMDGHFDQSERETILGLIERRFKLTGDEATRLLGLGERLQSQSNEVFKFTLAANRAFSEEERLELVEMLWTTVLCDGVVHDYEGNLMRRIAGLLHIPDKAAGEARKRAEQKLAQNGPGVGGKGQGDKA
ncbi:MAG TPA: TerB family tellurite resistance protein [Alphaproteobacteria bacterium]|nr:TerB family tellurite resistance protein [Alphaproteobacteria bacterium]